MHPLLFPPRRSSPTACSRCRSPRWPGIALGLILSVGAVRGGEAPLLGWETLTRPDRIAEYKPGIEAGSISSYDRSGGNDDGFSGKDSFVRKEAGGLVIADLQGPGVIYRIWTPTPTDDWMEFYFDGEAQPRIRVRFRDLFLGKTEPFTKPLVGYGVGGFFSYYPLAYAKSCKVLIRAERVQFYQINHARYAAGTDIQTYTATPEPGIAAQARRARELLAAAGPDFARFVAPPDSRSETVRRRVTVKPGKTVVLFERKQPGRLVGLKLGPAEALAGKARDRLLKISFDGGAPSVLVPVGDFFGYAWGKPAARSLWVGSTAREAYCNYPMPFDRSARIELITDGAGAGTPDVDLEVTAMVSPVARRSNEGRFGAIWRRENPTRIGEPFTFIDAPGRGHLVGFTLQAQGFESGRTLFFEGDDVTTLDGRMAVHGTGSEDFFNGGWYDVPDRWEKPLNFPLSGCLGYDKHLGRTAAYRFLMGDAYHFDRSVKQTIEHSGAGNDILTDYTGVTYYYADHPLASALPSATARAVTDPTEAIFVAAWEIPIRGFPFGDTTLTRKVVKLGDEEVRFLSVRGGAPDWVGPPYLYITCNVPAAGRYAVSVDTVRGPEQGRLQLFQDEVPIGEPVDLYAESPARSGRVTLGEIDLLEGDNPVMLKLVGKNDASRAVGLDLVQIVCRRLNGH